MTAKYYFDVRFAREKGLKIKLVAKVIKINAHGISLYVAPGFVSRDKYIYNVAEEYKKQKYFKKPAFTKRVLLTIYLRYDREKYLRHFDFEEVFEQ